MTWTLSTPVTGGAQTGFTAPTYTVALDKAPDVNGTQYAVTALGGTQTGVTAHSMSSPFFVCFWRPKTYKVIGKTNPVTGLLPANLWNVFKRVVQKGTIPLAGQPAKSSSISTIYSILAGADTADAPNVRALVSFDVGVANQTSSGTGDTLVTGLV